MTSSLQDFFKNTQKQIEISFFTVHFLPFKKNSNYFTMKSLRQKKNCKKVHFLILSHYMSRSHDLISRSHDHYRQFVQD